MNAKYGYCIISTPGLLQDGTFPLRLNGERARIASEPENGWDAVPAWETREAAELAMHAMVPEGSTPATWAGLAVVATVDGAPEHLVYGQVAGQNGFVVPECRC